MEAILCALISPFVSQISEFSLSLLREEPRELENLPRHVSCMRHDLEYFRDGIKEVHRSIIRKAWLSELTCFANQLEDAIDQYEWANTRDARISLAREVELIQQKLEDGLSKRSSGATTTNPAQGQKDRPPDDSQKETLKDLIDREMVGLEEALEELRELLLKPKLKAICIVGFGGIGKTSLAKKLCSRVQKEFPRQALVSASGKDAHALINKVKEEFQNLDKGRGMDEPTTFNNNNTQKIDVKLGVNGGSTSNENRKLKNAAEETPQAENTDLKSNHRSNRRLVVIDDVKECGSLNCIMDDLPQDSRIIATTTIQSVAGISSCDRHVYRLKTLDGHYSKQLFSQVASTEKYSYAQEQATLSAIDICDGLPLALVSIGKFLKHKVQGQKQASVIERECKAALEACRVCDYPSPSEDKLLGRMKWVLFDNYHNLNCDVINKQVIIPDSGINKDCLLYLCMFPRGHPVKRNSLIRRWMAEGLVQDRLDVAEKNLDILIDRNIIHPIHEDVKRCQPPAAIMLEYISHQSKSEGFMRALPSPQRGMPQQDEYVRRLSVHNYDDNINIEGSQFPTLRTLAVFRANVEGATVGFKANFADYKLLRVLDLEECNGLDDSHLKAICNKPPRLLKYLSLGGSITEVPRKITTLEYLQTLDLRKCNSNRTIKVYVEVFLLHNLKHLLGIFRVPKLDSYRSTETSNLETLSGFVVQKRRGISWLMISMKRLRKVKIRCESTADEINLTQPSQAIKDFILNVNNTPGDRSLSINLMKGCKLMDSLQKATNNISFVSSSLYSLKLKGSLRQFPPFVSKVNGITKLCLCSTGLTGDMIISGIKGLNVLTHLKLVEDGLGNLAIGSDILQSLERLYIVSAEENLPNIQIQSGALESIISISLQLLPSRTDIRNRIDLWKKAAREHPNMPNLFIENTSRRE